MRYSIEFLGLPGSGKSTLYNELIKKTNNSYFDLENALEFSIKRAISSSKSNKRFKKIRQSIIYKLTKSLVYPVYETNVFMEQAYLSKLADSPNLNNDLFKIMKEFKLTKVEKKKVFSSFFELSKKYFLVEKFLASNESLILDEGFIHFSSYIWQRNRKEKENYSDLNNYINLIPKPNILFYLHVKPEVAYNRLIKREKFPPPYQELSKVEKIEKLESTRKSMDFIINNIEKTKILFIDNNQNLNNSIEQLINYINKLVV